MVKLKKIKKEDLFNTIQNYFFIVVGLFIYAFGWSAFIIPSHLTGGGVAGLSTILHFAFGTPIGMMNLIINGILIAVAFKILGPRFIIKTIICTVLVSVFFDVLTPQFPEPLIKDNLLTCTLLGGALSAIGIGLVITNGGNSGGTDIIVLMISKYRNISYGKTSMMINIIIIALLILVEKDIEKLLYSYLNMIIGTTMSDLVIGGFRQSFQIMVFSPSNDKIAERISKEAGRGVTILKGYGWFTQKEQDVLVTMLHRTEKYAVMRIIKQEDPNAFVSVSKVQGVFGKNFEELKISSKK
ncbi:MAG: YitT family protein [Bacteroidales bacterium]|jgi:uncharacterized membrane-anchored protein YitT (DUF2179 family)|nr:YitT family protein [Bacteroidales bacterium]